MIDLNITLYKDADGNDRFKVMAPSGEQLVDVTDQYEMAATSTPDGRTGFAVFRTEVLRDCPYSNHADDCDCRGMGGDR